MKHRTISIFLLAALALPLLAGCASTPPATSSPAATAVSVTQPAATAVSAPAASTAVSATAPAAQPAVAAATLAAYAKVLSFNNAAWKFDAANNVYWQIGLQYSLTPETKDYETLGIYVPGAYLTAKDNGDGTYTAALNPSGSLNGFTAKTAPMVYPVSTPGYSAQKAPTAYNYDDVSSYLKAGFIYVYPGMRGKANGYDANKKLTYSGGAPWGVTDLKAAVRYIRYNQAVLPGNTASMFVFGMSGGGAQSSVMGASGDSPLYTPYLQSIGAAMADANGAPLSDAISGVMAWCPITSLDYADEAYEWNMCQYVSTGTRATTTWTSALSKDLASAYADYINKLGLKDQNGSALLLESSSTGIYTSGSYAAYLKTSIEQSLNNFLADTKFPYTATSGGFPGGGPQGGAPADGGPQGGPPPDGTPQAGDMPAGGPPAGATQTSTTYQTVQDYIASLNKDSQWVTYNAATNTASISSVADFVTHLKTPSKSVAAFDSLDRAQAENDAFGNDTSDALHFDPFLADLLAKNQKTYAAFSDWKADYVAAYATDLKAVDKLGNGMQYRMNMYNPMYYLLAYYGGYKSSTPAAHWRINTGIDQGDTANTVEMNLALALQSYQGVKDVSFTTVWDQRHVEAERTGDSTANFIAWVTSTVKK